MRPPRLVTSPVSGEATMPTRRPLSTSREGSRAIASISGAPSGAPFIQPPLNSSSWPPLWRRKSDSALAAAAASPRTNVIAVGPSSSSLRASAPALSAARSVSVFLTTRKLASASRSLVRSSAACGTEMPR